MPGVLVMLRVLPSSNGMVYISPRALMSARLPVAESSPRVKADMALFHCGRNCGKSGLMETLSVLLLLVLVLSTCNLPPIE